VPTRLSLLKSGEETEGGRFHCVSQQLKKRGREFSPCFFMVKTETSGVFRMPALYERGTPVGKYPFMEIQFPFLEIAQQHHEPTHSSQELVPINCEESFAHTVSEGGTTPRCFPSSGRVSPLSKNNPSTRYLAPPPESRTHRRTRRAKVSANAEPSLHISGSQPSALKRGSCHSHHLLRISTTSHGWLPTIPTTCRLATLTQHLTYYGRLRREVPRVKGPQGGCGRRSLGR